MVSKQVGISSETLILSKCPQCSSIRTREIPQFFFILTIYSTMRFAAFFIAIFAALAFASPVITKNDVVLPSSNVARAENDFSGAVVKKDDADDLAKDIERLLGDFVYNVEGFINFLGYNVTEIFNEVGLTPPPDTHGDVIDATRLIVDTIKDLLPIAIRFGINLLKLVVGLI